VMAGLKLKWERPGFIPRKGSKVNPQIVDAAFKLDHPVDTKPVFDGKPLSSGDFAVYGLYAVKEGDPATADKKTVEALKKSLEREHGQVVFKDYADALKAGMKISRFPKNI
jgi:peptidyl-prolyl cis-trans isomerase D